MESKRNTHHLASEGCERSHWTTVLLVTQSETRHVAGEETDVGESIWRGRERWLGVAAAGADGETEKVDGLRGCELTLVLVDAETETGEQQCHRVAGLESVLVAVAEKEQIVQKPTHSEMMHHTQMIDDEKHEAMEGAGAR